MRVVAGSVGGRRLQVPSGARSVMRPTTELVRGAIGNSLSSLGALQGATVWDLFAGSGALGIEALSRGAASATFVDNDKTAVAAIRANVDALGLVAQATVVTSDVIGWLAGAGSADVAFVDPPYAFDDWATLLGAVAVELAVCESDRAIDAPEGWTIRNVRQHGGTLVSLLERRGAAP